MKTWLYSRKNIASCGVATLGIVLYLSGLIDNYWYLIVAGMYAVTYYAVPNEMNKAIVASHPTASLQAYKGLITELIAKNKQQLPSEALAILLSINQTSEELIEFTNNNTVSFFDENISNVERIFQHYLPNVINRYVKIPTRYAQTVIIKDKKTTKDFLIEQLALLDIQIQKVAHAVYENDSLALVTHSRLLKEKFKEHHIFDLIDNNLEIEKEINE